MIGGAETWLYNISTELSKYCNVAVLYDIGNPVQIARLGRAGIKCWKAEKGTYWNCDVFLRSLNFWPPCRIQAKRYVSMIHSNFGDDIMLRNKFMYNENGLITNYVAASEYAAKSFEKIFPERSVEHIDNLVIVPDDRKTKNNKKFLNNTLRLLTISRFSEEKGLRRMIKVAQGLRSAGVKYQWDVFTNSIHQQKVPRGLFSLHDSQLDLSKEVRDADYVVQLSDSEAFCYSMHEALAMGTPVLVTDWGGVRKWVHDGENGYILNMDLSNFKPKKIMKDIPHGFDYQSPSKIEDWLKYFNKILGMTRPDGTPWDKI